MSKSDINDIKIKCFNTVNINLNIKEDNMWRCIMSIIVFFHKPNPIGYWSDFDLTQWWG